MYRKSKLTVTDDVTSTPANYDFGVDSGSSTSATTIRVYNDNASATTVSVRLYDVEDKPLMGTEALTLEDGYGFFHFDSFTMVDKVKGVTMSTDADGEVTVELVVLG